MDRTRLSSVDQSWAMDFVADNLFNEQRCHVLTMVDDFTSECLEIHVNHTIKGQHVVSRFEWLQLFSGGKPLRFQVDNGSEFIFKAHDIVAYKKM